MNLKKTDKIIAIVGVIILIVAAVGIILYTSYGNEEEDDTDEPVLKTFDVTWTKYSKSTTIEGYAASKGSYTDPFDVNAPSDSVLTNVDVKLIWEDDVVKKGLLKTKCQDTLTAKISLQGGAEQDYVGIGSGNETMGFTVNSIPVDDFVDAEDYTEVEGIVEDEYGNKDKASFETEVNVKLGEGFFNILKKMKDKGNDFTLEITYDYYSYDIEEIDDGDDEDKGTDLGGDYMDEAISEMYKSMSHGRGMI